jgi:hypothetical protein
MLRLFIVTSHSVLGFAQVDHANSLGKWWSDPVAV